MHLASALVRRARALRVSLVMAASAPLGLVDDVLAVGRHGLLSLGRARLIGPDERETWLAGLPDATKLTLYVGRRERVHGGPAFLAVRVGGEGR